MQADIGRPVYTVGKIERVIILPPVFGKSKIALPQPDEVAFFQPPGKIVPVKAGLPGRYLVNGKAGQREHFFLKFQEIHLVLFLFCTKNSEF